MENYVLNFVASSLVLLLHYRLLQTLLIGEAARYGTAFSTTHAVRVVQGFSRGVEHNVKFYDELMVFARSSELQKSDGLAVLLRN